MLFLIDANLPPALAVAITLAGHRSLHVEEIGLRNSEDDEIWNYALQHGAIVVTKDEDFPRRCVRLSTTPIVIWLRIGNCRNHQLLAWFLPVLPEVIAQIELGDRLIEVN